MKSTTTLLQSACADMCVIEVHHIAFCNQFHYNLIYINMIYNYFELAVNYVSFNGYYYLIHEN